MVFFKTGNFVFVFEGLADCSQLRTACLECLRDELHHFNLPEEIIDNGEWLKDYFLDPNTERVFHVDYR